MLQLLRTKTTIPPARPKQVERVRLVRRIEEGMQRALTLIVAPAGFGKTTLVADWARSDKMPVAWLGLEPADQTPERFFSYLIQALQTLDVQIGQTSLVLLRSGQAKSDEPILLALLNDLSEIAHDFALILDDFHTVDSPAMCAIVQFFLEHRPPGLHLALTSRRMPSLNVARLRAQDQVVEIGAAELRFTDEETRGFVEDVMNEHLEPDQLARLSQTTEGWAVGLQLASLAYRQQPKDWAVPTGQEMIFEYLASEVLRRESPDVQQFLITTALFDRFCAPLCERLLQPADQAPAAILAYVERANLFLIPLDASKTWFRYHGLFSDFLRKQFPQEQAPRLYHTASEWFEANGLIDDAIHYAAHANDYERTARLIEANYRALLLRGEQAALLDWMRCIPKETVAAHPRLALTKGWAAVILLDMDAAAAAADEAEACLHLDPEENNLRGELKSMRILMSVFQGKFIDPSEFSEAFVLISEQDGFLQTLLYFNLSLSNILLAKTVEALESLNEAVRLSEKQQNHLVQIIARTQLGEQYQIHGELELAESAFLQAIRYTKEMLGEHSFLLGMPFVSYAELLREQNRFDEAIQYAEQGIAYCHAWSPVASLDGLLTLGRLEAGRGNWAISFPYFDRAMEMAKNTRAILDDTFVGLHVAHAYLLHGDLASAEKRMKSYEILTPFPMTYSHLLELKTLVSLRADILRAERDPAEIAKDLGMFVAEVENRERVPALIEGLILKAYILHISGKHSLAVKSLDKALKLGAAFGYLRIFLDEGDRLANLLMHYRTRLTAPGVFWETVVSLFQKKEAAPGNQEPPDQRLTILEELTPLTRREIEILRLLAEGKSNKEIASECTLTMNTVKKHVANILAKLGVSNRTQAGVVAKKAGWIR